jgi:hypothetical protein
MGHRQELQLVAVHLGALLEQRDRLFAVWRVMVDESDLLALELVDPAFLLADVLHENVGRIPVRSTQREVPAEDGPVDRVGAAIAAGDDGDAVVERFVGDREGDSGRQGVERRRAGRALALEPLVALHAAVGGIAGLAFLERDADAVDAAVAGVDELEIVHVAVGERDAVGGVRAGAVHQHREKLLFGLRESGCAERDRGRCRHRRAGEACRACESHTVLLEKRLFIIAPSMRKGP